MDKIKWTTNGILQVYSDDKDTHILSLRRMMSYENALSQNKMLKFKVAHKNKKQISISSNFISARMCPTYILELNQHYFSRHYTCGCKLRQDDPANWHCICEKSVGWLAGKMDKYRIMTRINMEYILDFTLIVLINVGIKREDHSRGNGCGQNCTNFQIYVPVNGLLFDIL